MNIRYVPEQTMFQPSQLFRNWFSNESDLDSGAAGDDGRVHYTAVDLLLL
jgi:hypothetical protein